jgi:tetratricopeptide (TPR) repeat protein
MTDIKILYDNIYSDGIQKPPKVFIDIYEENKNLIESADTSTSNPDYDGIMRITAEYGMALSSYGSSKKSLPYLDKAIQLFKDSSQTDLTKVQMYETLVWVRGTENYNQKNYSLAAKDFQYLVDNYPDNDKYRNWLLASKTIQTRKYVNYVWGATAVFLVWEIMVSKEDRQLKNYLLIATSIFFVIAIIGEIANAVIKSRIKKQ